MHTLLLFLRLTLMRTAPWAAFALVASIGLLTPAVIVCHFGLALPEACALGVIFGVVFGFIGASLRSKLDTMLRPKMFNRGRW